MQRAGLLDRGHLALGLGDGDRAGRMGERCGKEIGAAEDRLAFREMLHRPGDGFRRWRCRRSFRCCRETGFVCHILGGLPLPGRCVHGRSAGLLRVNVVERRRRRFPGPIVRPGCRFHCRFPCRHGGLAGSPGNQGTGVETEIRRLPLPHAPELVAVDVALLRARH